MEEKKTIFGYLAEVLAVYGFMMLVLNSFCLMFGTEAQGFSTMFGLGGRGVPVEISFQFLGIAALVVWLRFLFFTDTVIKKMPVWLRTAGMVGVVLAAIVACIFAFGWFPVHMWQAWVSFFACFGVSFLGSLTVMVWKERVENRRMQEALRKMKESKGEGR